MLHHVTIYSWKQVLQGHLSHAPTCNQSDMIMRAFSKYTSNWPLTRLVFCVIAIATNTPHLRAATQKFPDPVVNGNWWIDADELVTEGGKGGKHIEFGDPNWSDYDLRVDVKVVKQGELSVIFRVKDGNFWKLDFCAWGDKDNLDLLAKVEGEDRWKHPSRRWMHKAIKFEIDKWYEVRVETRGEKVTVFINGKKYTESKHGALLNGRIGAYTYGNSAGRFRGFRVTSTDGKLLWKGVPSLSENERQPDSDLNIETFGGNGLIAEFFDDDHLGHSVGKQLDPNIDCQWGKPHPNVPVDHFSVRWTGWIKAPTPGAYKLILLGDDGFRLYIDNKRVIDSWNLGFNHKSGTVELTGEPQEIRIEYFEDAVHNWISFWWQPLGAGRPSLVPSMVLFPNKESATKPKSRTGRQLPPHGLVADYYDINLKRRYERGILYRLEPCFGDWSPSLRGPIDGIARYSGYLVPQKSGRYRLVAVADDRLRVAIDGKAVLEANFGQEGGSSQGYVELQENVAHKLAIEFRDGGAWGAWYLHWAPPGETEEQSIPPDHLYPDRRALPRGIKFAD